MTSILKPAFIRSKNCSSNWRRSSCETAYSIRSLTWSSGKTPVGVLSFNRAMDRPFSVEMTGLRSPGLAKAKIRSISIASQRALFSSRRSQPVSPPLYRVA